MQRTKSKILSILLSLVMLLSLLPTTALAAGYPDSVRVYNASGDIKSLSDKQYLAANDATNTSDNYDGSQTYVARYDKSSGTLYLNDYHGAATDGQIYAHGDLNIEVVSDSSFSTSVSATNNLYGIQANGTLKISGSGKLTVTANGNGNVYGIYADEGVTISAPLDVRVGKVDSTKNGPVYGIYTEGGAISLSGAEDKTITATGGKGLAYGVYSADNSNITISGKLTVSPSDGTFNYGIYTGSGSTITLDAATLSIQSGFDCGIYNNNGNVVIKNSPDVTLNSDKSSRYGIWTNYGGDLTIENSTVKVSANGFPADIKGNVSIQNSTVELTLTGDNYEVIRTGNSTTANTIDLSGSGSVTLTAPGNQTFAMIGGKVTATPGTKVEKGEYNSDWKNYKGEYDSANNKTVLQFVHEVAAPTTLKGIDIITNPALTLAVPTAAPNAAAANERSLAVTGVYDGGSGGPVAVNWKITTDPIPKGVSLDGSTLKVSNEAEAGQVRIEATSAEGYTDAEFVTITKDASVESAIVLTAPSPATVAVPKSDTPNEIALPTAAVYDQYGKPMTGTFSITYAIDGTTPTGVTLDTGAEKMKVKRTAQAGEVEVVAKLTTTAGTVTSHPVTYTITRETSKVTHVLVSKLFHNMPVPKVTEPGGTSSKDEQFTAEVLDQYLQEMTGQTVTWRVTDTAGNPVTGVSIDNTGKLTVTNEAPGIKVYAIATCQGVDSNNLDMTLHRDTAKDTFVKICNQVGDAPETSLLIPTGSIPRSEDYTAKVYDQYGKETAGMVFWKLDKTYTGVELDTTSIPGSATLKVGNTAAPGTIQLIANCSTVGSTASKTLDITLVNKTPASVTAVPAAQTGLFYNGTDQALVTAGTASGGTMQYSLDGTTWSTAVPTGKNVGAYTVQYKVVGDATHTDTAPQTCQMVMISPKFLTMDNLTPTGSTSKVYDGTTNSSITVGVKAGVLFGSDTLTITGTAVYNSANVNEANTITFTPDAITGNYELVPGVLTITGASITPRDLIVTPNGGQNKKFGAEDPTLHSTNSGRVPGQIPDFSGALSRAEGEDVGQYDITLGTLALIDHFSSGFKASNYTLKMVSPAVKFEITKADAPAAPTGLKGYKDSALSTVTLPTGWSWVDGTLKMNTIGDQTFKANYAGDTNHQAGTNVDVTVKVVRRSSGGGGGSYYAPVVPDMPMVYWGCTGDAVKTLQDKLNALGYNSGSVDGIFGAKTYAAVTAFQKANSLGVDGIVGKLTWAKLYDATPVNVTPVTTQPMLRTGSRGDAVRKLQELLNAKGYTCGSVDGIFGSKTYAAVLAFQKANGLAADGIVGSLTWGKLV